MRKVVTAFLLLVLCVVPSRAALEELPETKKLWQQAEHYGITQDTGLERGLKELFSEATDRLHEMLREYLGTVWKLVAVALLCALARGAEGEGHGIGAVEIAGAISITALTMTDITSMVGLGRETVERMEVFSQALLPVMALLSAATGGATSAALRQGATVLVSQLLVQIMDRVLIPMVYAYVAVHFGYAITENPGLQRIGALVKSCINGLLTAALLLFVSYLTASGAISGSADAAAVKAMRITISRAIPVVGGILSDAAESVLVGAGILRGSVGVAGLLVVLTICLTPFLRLSIQYLLYKVTAAVCATVAQPRLSQLIDAIGTAFGLVLGMTGACALVLLVSIVSAVSAAVPG